MSNLLRTLRIGFAIFRAICLSVLLLGFALQFSAIQTYVINTFVLDKNSSIQIEGSSGFFPFYFSIEKVLLFKEDQQILSIQDFEVDWSLLELIRNKILAVHTLKVRTLEYKELLTPGQLNPQKEAPATIAFPKIPLGYISNINISKASYIAPKREFNYSIHGKTEHKQSGIDFDLKLTNLITQKENLSAIVHYNFATPSTPSSLHLDINASEENGIIQYLIPTINGAIILNAKGDGSLNDFNGVVTAKIGKTSSFISDISLKEDEDRKHLLLVTNSAYKNQIEQYVVSGKVRSTKAFTKLELFDWRVVSGKSTLMTMVGNIQRRGHTFSTKDLIVQAPLSSSQKASATLSGMVNLKPFMIDGLVKGSLTDNDKRLSDVEVPISMKDTLDSLKISLKGKGTLPALLKEYAELSEYTLSAQLTPKSAATTPTITFELRSNNNSLTGSVAFKDAPEFSIDGQLLSHNIKIDALLKNGAWNITGHTHPVNHQSWAVQTFKAKLGASPKMKFDAQTTLNVASKEIDLELKGEFDSTQQLLDLTSLRAVHKESFLEGKGFFDFTKNEGNLNWHLYTFNLGDVLSKETASGTASILGQLSLDSKDCLLTFSGDFHKLVLSPLVANSGNLSGSVYLNNNKNVQLSLAARKASIRKTVIEEFSVNTNGTLDDFSTTMIMSGFSGQAFKANIAFSIAQLSSLNIDTASINLGANRIFLEKSARVDFGTTGWTTKTPIILNANKGSINLTGNFTESALTCNAEISKIPSDILSTLTNGAYFLKGDIDGKFHIHGGNDSPTMKFDLQTTGPLYSTKLVGNLDNSLLNATFDIKSDLLNINLKGTYPSRFRLAPFDFELDQNQPFETQIIAKGKLDNLQQIFDFNYDKITGDVDADVRFFGYLSRQSCKGYINVDNGGYERQNIGLSFKDIDLRFASSKGGFLVLTEPVPFKDQKDKNGKILFAKFSLGSDLIPVLSTEITSDNLQIINISQNRRGGMSALYTGNLKADGPVSGLKIYCRGSISSLEKYIGEIDDVPIFQVNEIHQNLPLSAPLLSTARKSEISDGMTYDIDLSLERSFHIYGQGLDSTWNGRLIIEGSADSPIYKGQFKLREGQLRVLDKFFDVQRGEIYFDGDLSPRLYIESNLNLNDLRVKIILEGDANNLQKRIVSDSDLSEQEVLQKLFFNRSSTVSQSFQALNYIAASSFISSFINIGFYEQEDPITHAEREFVSLHQRFSKRTYGKIDVAINNIDSGTSRVSISAGFQPTPKTKTEIIFSPDKTRLGAGFEWSHDF